MSQKIQTFNLELEAAKSALDGDHIGTPDLDRLKMAHHSEIEDFQTEIGNYRESIADLIETIALFREMESEFNTLKSELEANRSPGRVSPYFVGLSVGILSEMFTESKLEGLPFTMEDISQ